MDGMGSVSKQQQAQALQERALAETQREEAQEAVGAGHASAAHTLSIGHNTSAVTLDESSVALAAIPGAAEGALDTFNMMDSSDLQAIMAGLRGETDEVQTELQLEAIEQQKQTQKTENSEKLEELSNELKQLEEGNKCAQITASICLCIPGLNLLVGLPAQLSANAGEEKAAAIRAEMMTLTHGPHIGGLMVQFMEDFNAVMDKGLLASEDEKDQVTLQIEHLHRQGVIDDVAHFELMHLLNNDSQDSQTISVDQRLTDLAMGIKQPMLSPETYPPELLAANGYLSAEIQAEETQATNDQKESSAFVESPLEDSGGFSTEWLQQMTQQMQAAEEEDRVLSEIQQSIEETKSAILQSNQDAKQQQGAQQQMI